MTFIKPTSTAPFSIIHENMMRAVTAFTLNPENIAITNSVPAFAIQINVVNTNLTTIDNLRASIAPPITGYAAQKKAAKLALAELTATVMKAAYSYAIDNNDDVLANMMRISPSDLKEKKYVTLYQFSQGAMQIITPIVPSLLPYNITGQTINTWQELSDQLNSFIANPRNAIVNRKTVNQQIQALLRQNMIILTEQTDTAAFQFRTGNLPYYNSYISNRMLLPHSLSTQLRFWATDSSGAPLTRGQVFILATDRSAEIDNNGYALIDHIPYGSHQVSFTNIAGTVMYGPFDFKKGHSLTLHAVVGTTASATPRVTVPKQEKTKSSAK